LTIQDENSTEFLCDLYEQESSWSNKQKPNFQDCHRNHFAHPRQRQL